MKLIIFGATGQVGIQLVKQALWKGHSVKAFGRNVYKLEFDDEKLERVTGAVFDEDQVYSAIKGCDAVLSALGGDFTGEDKTRSLGIKKIIAQMQKAGVKRIVALGNRGVLSSADGSFIMESKDYPAEYLPVGNEHLQAYKYLAASDLDWTFVGSPDIVNAEATGSFITSAEFPPEGGKGKITTGDLALFMIGELEKNEFVKKRVGISN